MWGEDNGEHLTATEIKRKNLSKMQVQGDKVTGCRGQTGGATELRISERTHPVFICKDVHN